MLGVLTVAQLAHAAFPLGDSLKADVRAEATERGLAVADKPDSHDICFIADGDTGGFLASRIGDRPGDIVDQRDGTVLGQHEGTHRFTVGQRRGLGLRQPAADGSPRFVLSIEPVAGTVTVGPRERLAVDALTALRPRWCGPAPDGSVEVTAQVRAHGQAWPAVARLAGPVLHVRFTDPADSVAPGQAVVLYDGTRVVGSATVDTTVPVAAP